MELVFRWVTDAPVYEVGGDLKQVIERFEQGIDLVPDGIADEDRRDDYLLILSHFRSPDPSYRVFQYKVSTGFPLALMSLAFDKACLEIEDLVASPRFFGAAEIMIEFALNLLEGYRRLPSGIIKLQSVNAHSTNAYHALGFRVDAASIGRGTSPRMTLNANQSGLWERVGGQWKQAFYTGTKHLDMALR